MSDRDVLERHKYVAKIHLVGCNNSIYWLFKKDITSLGAVKVQL